MSPMLPLHPAHPMRGRGMWVWEGVSNNAELLVRELKRHDFRWLAIKAQEGTHAYQPVQVRRYADACRHTGIELLLWGYLHGDQPEAEANLAIALCRRHGATGYIADCEIEYERARAGTSERLAHALNHGHPRLALALSSFGRVDFHRGIDWGAFARNRFCFMPQAYECESHELTPQLCISTSERFWHRGMILPTLGSYQGAAGHLNGARLARSIEHEQVRGFSVWAAHTTNADQLRALSRA